MSVAFDARRHRKRILTNPVRVVTVQRVRAVTALASLATAAVLMVASAEATPTRDALLRPGIGAGEVRLGMTFSQVRKAIGRPTRVERREMYRLERYVEYTWGINSTWRVGLHGRTLATSRVVFLQTTRRERTAGGAGVGSTYRKLQRTLGARCYRQRSGLRPQPSHSDFVGCYLGKRGEPVTYFPLYRDCALPEDRYYLCPFSHRRYVAYGVSIADSIGQEIKGIREYPR